MADAKYNGGDYDPNDPPKAGLAAARMTAMLTYRSPTSIDDRFKQDRLYNTTHALILCFQLRLIRRCKNVCF